MISASGPPLSSVYITSRSGFLKSMTGAITTFPHCQYCHIVIRIFFD